MQPATLAFLAALFVHTIGVATPECRCWRGLDAVVGENGVVHCRSVRFRHNMECNIPEPPPCKCSGVGARVSYHKKGCKCVHRKGSDTRTWECENAKDWEVFYALNPERKGTLVF